MELLKLGLSASSHETLFAFHGIILAVRMTGGYRRSGKTPLTRSTIGGGGWGCNNFVTVLGGNDTKIAPTGDIFDQPLGQMR